MGVSLFKRFRGHGLLPGPCHHFAPHKAHSASQETGLSDIGTVRNNSDSGSCPELSKGETDAFEMVSPKECDLLFLFLSMAVGYGAPSLALASDSLKIPRAMTYSEETAQVIRLEFGQSVAVKKLSKIEKTAIKLSQWVN